jgi:hypothetical protein
LSIALLLILGLVAILPASPHSHAGEPIDDPPLTRAPAPTPTPTPAPLPQHAQVIACNRPASDMPPSPDGCPYWEPIAPVDLPIPPPCFPPGVRTSWQYWPPPLRVELHVEVLHPELSSTARTYTILERTEMEPWHVTYADWEVSCGKDEGPLTWLLLQLLNSPGRRVSWGPLEWATAQRLPNHPRSSRGGFCKPLTWRKVSTSRPDTPTFLRSFPLTYNVNVCPTPWRWRRGGGINGDQATI